MNIKLTLIAILLLGFLLRFHNYSTWPREGATFDEYAWVWLGMNLIQKGTPISWSPHPQYKIRTHYVAPGGARFWLVEPYLEHPPLFGLVAGGYALAAGIPDMYHVSLPTIRELALILGVASIYLVFLLATSLYGSIVGILASFFYAIIPTVVVGSRIVENENFFIPVFLSILLLLKNYLDSGKRNYVIAAAIVSGLATLAKVPWIAAAISGAMILLYKRKIKDMWLYLAIVFGIFILFLIYGVMWDKELFFSLWRLQLARYDMVFDSIYALLSQPYLVDRYYTDGWIYAGWIAFAVLLLGNLKRNYIIVFGLLGYFLVYILGIPNEPSHGWYRFPFYPFLAIALSNYLVTQRRNYLLTPLILLGITLTLMQHTWGVVFGFSFVVYRLIIVWFGLSALPVWFANKRISAFARLNTYIQLGCVVLLSIWSVLLYNEQ